MVLIFVPSSKGLIALKTISVFFVICIQTYQFSFAGHDDQELSDYVEERYSTFTLMIM